MIAAVFDYGAGNLHSLGKALRREGAEVMVTADPRRLLDGDAIVLPGVGAFDSAAERLEPARDELRAAVCDGHPCLGICLGMQLLFDDSEEGRYPGLGILRGSVRRIQARRVPQMGWNTMDLVRDDPLFHGIPEPCAYFANSYAAHPADRSAVLAECDYFGASVVAAVGYRRTRGVQFHPEKSGAQGLRLLRNFLTRVAA